MVGIEELRQALYGFGGVLCYTHYFIHNIFFVFKNTQDFIHKVIYNNQQKNRGATTNRTSMNFC